MRIFKNRLFDRWAVKEGLTDECLRKTVNEIEQGLIDAVLGGNIIKQRVAVSGKGKSSGLRTLLVYKENNKAFFVYGFAKNVRQNINKLELKALKYLAKELLSYSDDMLMDAIKQGELKEVNNG